ncbi:MAG: DUF3147 family protein [Phycisphaerae bacterium]|nr:DUF3147 family protein [Phycisphaerae bacterium]
MLELFLRFIIGGFFVCAFATISDLFRPKTFSGLFGAAPSVALASLCLTIATKGQHVATVETRSMMLGAIAMCMYACICCLAVFRLKLPVMVVSLGGLIIWIAAATGLWYVTR